MTVLNKYAKTAAMEAATNIGESRLFLADSLLRFLRVVVMLSLWRVLFAGKGNVSGMSLNAVLTYTLIANAFEDQLEVRVNLRYAIWDGTLASRFLRPLGIFGQFSAETFGRWGFRLGLFTLPLLCVAPFLGVNPLPVDIKGGLLFTLSLVLAILVGLAIEFILGIGMVLVENSVYAIDRIQIALRVLLSGSFLPLALMPWGLGNVFAWLPFASAASAPLQIYTGTGDPVKLLLLQVGWILVLWPLAHSLWRVCREKLLCCGG